MLTCCQGLESVCCGGRKPGDLRCAISTAGSSELQYHAV
jgi:hypothetical protein